MNMKQTYRRLYKLFQKHDPRIVRTMEHLGHKLERSLIALVFVWFGSLKVFGQESATSIIAKTIYWFDPKIVVPVLGYWEILIGLTLAWTITRRLAVFLLLLRLPGSLLALFFNFEKCFDGTIFLPNFQGQYLIKELTLIGAALLIGSTVRKSIYSKPLPTP